jgi:hypothetical protein
MPVASAAFFPFRLPYSFVSSNAAAIAQLAQTLSRRTTLQFSRVASEWQMIPSS